MEASADKAPQRPQPEFRAAPPEETRQRLRLELYEEYSREEVHDIFAPGTPFRLGTGTWGIQGIVGVPDRPGDYVFIVNLGQRQGDYTFDEGVAEGGVLSWQSQRRQDLGDRRVQEFIQHDELKNSIYLFLKASISRTRYTYLGKLKYLSHDSEREKPVYFQWQLLDWPMPYETANRLGLVLPLLAEEGGNMAPLAEGALREASPPRPRATGKRQTTPTFRAHKPPDHSALESRNRELGLKGEELVVAYEKQRLKASSSPDLAEEVRHVSEVEGDGAGYDIESRTPEGQTKYIEVKTTRGPAETPFFMSKREVEFAGRHAGSYYLYRVYCYDDNRNSGTFYVCTGNVMGSFHLTPTEYRVVRATS